MVFSRSETLIPTTSMQSDAEFYFYREKLLANLSSQILIQRK